MTPEQALAEDLQRIVLSRLADRTLKLPAMRASVIRCMSMIAKEDFSLHDIAQVVETDPVLAARVLGISNSAAFAAPTRVRSILAAVTRIGGKALRTVLFEAATNQVFESSDAHIAAACRGLWTHSRAVALLAREVAERAMLVDSSDAYLTGLLHDVGKPIIAALLLRSEQRLLGQMTGTWFDAEAWVDIVQLAHRPVAIALATEWNLPDTVVSAVTDCSEYDEHDPRSVPNCVCFANALAKEQGLYVGKIDPDANAGILRAGALMLGLDNAEANALREGLRARVALGYED
jgi:putative nucleotidyltransferase with HDIG domain